MRVELGYGRGTIAFDYDEARFQTLAVEGGTAARPLSDVEIGERLDAPIDSPPLHEIVSPGETVLLVVPDATRASASGQIVNLLVRRLVEIGVAPADVRIIFATGIHRPVTAAERRDLLTPFVAQRIKTLDHDAHDEAGLVNLGATERGTPVVLNRALTEHDHVILVGAINFHYFASFTGGRKAVCPGLAATRTVEATHMLALDFERGGRRAGVGTGLLDGNPVHEEMTRVAAFVKPSFLVNTIVDDAGRAAEVYAGDWRAAHRRGCEEYRRAHTVEIKEKRELVVASCGGAPYDINLIQAHKALEMASQACADGGTIILLAECADGFGRADFLKWFTAAEDSRALEVILRGRYEVNGQTAWSLLTKAERFRVHLVSALADEDVRRMRMIPARTLADALAATDSRAGGYLLPRAATTLPALAS